MSFSFSLSAPERPDYQAVLFGLNLRDVQRLEEEDYLTEGPWPDGVVHFHRPGLSTRGVEVEWSDGEFIIEIPTLAAPEDYDLAFRFIESAATIFGGKVYPEEGESFAVEELRTLYNTEWMIQTNESAIVSIRALLKEEDQILMMFGTVRPFHIGAALLEELDELGRRKNSSIGSLMSCARYKTSMRTHSRSLKPCNWERARSLKRPLRWQCGSLRKVIFSRMSITSCLWMRRKDHSSYLTMLCRIFSTTAGSSSTNGRCWSMRFRKRTGQPCWNEPHPLRKCLWKNDGTKKP